MRRIQLTSNNQGLAANLYEAYCKEVERPIADEDAIHHNCERLAGWLCRPDGKRNLLIAGAPGTGKTTLLRALSNVLLRSWEGELPYRSLYYSHVTASAVFEHCSVQDIPEIVLTAHLLIIDDVASEPANKMEYGNKWQPIYTILKRRSDAKLPVIVSSNLTPERLRDYYDGNERLYDILQEYDVMLLTANQSYRRIL